MIEEYILVVKGGKREKDNIRKLLLVDLEKKLDEVQLPYEVKITSFQANEGLRTNLTDAFSILLKETTNSKKKTQERILLFSEYLSKKHKIDLELGDAFKRVAMDKYDRLVDLLKILNEGKTKKELEDYYNVSRKQLDLDINELVMGTKILGQDVKIRDYEYEKGRKIVYQSTVHPIFLPLNMTEVYYLVMGLKTLAKENKNIAGNIYNDLADRVYSQLSHYARNKVDMDGKEMDLEFPVEGEYEKFKGTRDEEEMVESDIKNKILYVFKAGIMCSVQFKDDNIPMTNCYLDYDIKNDNVYIKKALNGERIRKLDIGQILDIKYKYT